MGNIDSHDLAKRETKKSTTQFVDSYLKGREGMYVTRDDLLLLVGFAKNDEKRWMLKLWREDVSALRKELEGNQ